MEVDNEMNELAGCQGFRDTCLPSFCLLSSSLLGYIDNSYTFCYDFRKIRGFRFSESMFGVTSWIIGVVAGIRGVAVGLGGSAAEVRDLSAGNRNMAAWIRTIPVEYRDQAAGVGALAGAGGTVGIVGSAGGIRSALV